MDSGALSGKTALVTGGSSGIGLGCADALLADGAAVVLAARNPDRLNEAATGLRTAYPDSTVETVQCDVTDEDSVIAACAAANDVDGAFSIVVANAGYGSASPFHLQSLEEWNGIIGTNLTGAFLTLKHSVPHLVANGGGSIVAMSSIAGVETHRYMTPYTVSKAGLEMLVKQVADELGSSGVRCNAVRPGLVPTDATEAMFSMQPIIDDYMAQMPIGRTGTTEDIASLVRFLAGPESGWITGTCISADGGHHLRRGPNMDYVIDMMHGDNVRP